MGILKKFREWIGFQRFVYLNECQADWDYDTGEITREQKTPTKRGLIWSVISEIYYLIKYRVVGRIICSIKGHVLVDFSEAGPDSGNMDHGCDRCREFWSVPLY